ncbi:ADP-ribosyltransferase [Lentilactobacillus hilgardii]|uniref:ADP-ribosyltransferase n=1 Tax=Lentilactobacillus hilgardii TaxID=1588 RepID=UPI0021A848CB|nr:ADP-ribosyltransferase [Lentilactobacillus hilgardii]MCT3400771.1 ADP-ribosylating toxin [Lentilactobacillus hilgardii]
MTKFKRLLLGTILLAGFFVQLPVQAQSVRKEVQGNQTTYVRTNYYAHAVNVGKQQLVTNKSARLYSIANGRVDDDHWVSVTKNSVLTVKDKLTSRNGYVVTIPGNKNQFAFINPTKYVYSTAGIKNNPEKINQLTVSSKKWAKKLSKGQVKAIRYYTNNGYGKINTALRQPDDAASAKVKTSIKSISTGIQAFHLDQPTTVYRGISKEGLAKSLGSHSLKVGRQYHDPAYSSCTLSQMIALGFSKQHVVLKINLPTGYHGAYIDPVSTNVGEKEYLLDSGTKLMVTKVQQAKSTVHTVTTIKKKGKQTKKQVSNVKTNYRLVTLNLKQ